MIKLNKNTKVTFDPSAHTYTRADGVTLSGITSVLHKRLFPDMYNNIPQHILDAAAERGHKIHDDIDFVDSFGGDYATLEGLDYASLKGGHLSIGNEYLVSNNETHATCIDCVWHNNNDDTIAIVDIKTTSKIHDDYLRWQLSIGAYLFELQNPLKVAKLYCVWLPKSQYGKPERREFERIPDEEVIALLEADAKGEIYQPPFEYLPVAREVTENLPDELREAEETIISILSQKKELEEKEKALKDGFGEMMKKYNVKKWESDNISITLKADSTRESFDSARFKKDHPDLYDEYIKKSEVKGSVMFKIK